MLVFISTKSTNITGMYHGVLGGKTSHVTDKVEAQDAQIDSEENWNYDKTKLLVIGRLF